MIDCNQTQKEGRIIVISGATASGKSQLALNLAEKNEITIINADAIQIFQGLPILSAQPNILDQNLAPHKLYSKLPPNHHSSVANWLELCKEEVILAWNQNRLPVLVGGTGLYISSLINGLCTIPKIEPHFKDMAKKLFFELNLEKFRKRFGEEKIKDKQRLIRACEVFLQTQKPISYWQKQPNLKPFPNAKILHFNLNLPREKLYQNCNLRFEKMIESGAIKEVEMLIKKFPDLKNEAELFDLKINSSKLLIAKTLGFAEVTSYLRGEIDLSKLKEKASQKTRNYAKRQLTWFRNQFQESQMFCVENFEQIVSELN